MGKQSKQDEKDAEIVETLKEISTVSGRLEKRIRAFKEKHSKGGRHGDRKHGRKRGRGDHRRAS